MNDRPPRVSVATVGCKVNRFESEALEQSLRQRGFQVVGPGEAADVVIVNSCTVTHRSDRDTRALVRRARQAHPGARIVVTGCYAQVAPQDLVDVGADLVVGTGAKMSVPDLLERGACGVHRDEPADPVSGRFPEVRGLRGRARAYLKVQDGCEAFCAYCIVPYARGPSRSLPLDRVREGLASLGRAGYREVVLTGVHLGLWGRDLDPPRPLEALLDAAESSGIPRVRLSSLEPGELTPAVVDRLARSDVLCPHVHVPVQSGSDRILAAMGRPYGADRVRERVGDLAGRIEGVCIGMDLIVGFPGEGEAEFEETVRLVEELPVAYLHVFPFSPRRGTRAWDLPGRVPPGVIKRRAARLRSLSQEKRQAFRRSQVGRVLPALAEGPARGGAALRFRTRNYLAVQVDWQGPRPVDEVPVRVDALDGDVLRGTLVPDDACEE
ncbi:tRNA (N(6)-L-threonylcarbamoyladenosine(37)-C(2))-methylthiotransferase MtaB [Deferrisoma camini]|uniref:tRNA (N(6)-L-threonylcarbamoyladenosine(37)-C(2))- methylthiotransferase MtaB n=1 Tax=Deferrisoma camini TaxID=1035120 RepID=UPI00046C8E84|nr:tRNA (N(6)-L-threonylcarbamoyladenosine(37)-C(2))-methylthiotransferase MtaB [Deferrisoma camini]